MKTIVLVALLTAAGCSKKGSDCDSAIGKGMDNFSATLKANSGKSSMITPQIMEEMQKRLGTLRTTLIQRCTEDKWPAEVTTCFATVSKRDEMQACQSKLSPEQQQKVTQAVMQVMMSGRGGQMPAGVAGHPSALSGSGTAAPPADTTAPGSAPAPAGSAPAGSAPAPAGSAPAGSAAAPAGSAAPAAGGW
jgi:hypothetical protein